MSQGKERSRRTDLDGVTHWLIHQSAQRAPESLSSRLEEEWLADLESRSAALSRLRFAVGCCWAAMVIVNDCPRSRVPAASASISAGGVLTLTDRGFGYFSLRSATLFLIAGLHFALFYGMITTLSHTRGSTTPPDLQNTVVKPVPPVTSPSQETVVKNFTISVPRPDTETPPLPPMQSDVRAEYNERPVVRDLPAQPPETPTHIVSHVAGGPGAGFPEMAEFYPSHSIRLGEEGISTVRVCVDSRGRLTSEPATVNGSGSARLDEAALKLARAGSGHYRAATDDGQPVNSCYAFGVRFQLKK
jgi:TonB family protein